MKLYDTERSEEERRTAFRNGDVPVAVYGLGKMGLPLAAVYADVSRNVRGVDIDPDAVETINAGRTPFDHEPGLDDLVAETVDANALRATTEARQAASEAAVHVIIVPTLVTDEKEPDLSTVEAVVSDIAAGIEAGDLVVVESTVPPGTCKTVIAPMIKAESDLTSGEFGVSFCPERTHSGRALEDVRGSYPKVVGGIDDESTRAATAIYREITTNEITPTGDATTAEAVKIFEGIYRDVNIALVNEFAKSADDTGINVLEAIDVANEVPYVDLHDPGAGVGGHCIPYYPYFFTSGYDGPSDLTRTAREINDSMPLFAVDKLLEGLTEKGTTLADATVVVLGVTYRPGVDEIRHTPAMPIVDRLAGQSDSVYVVDPVTDNFDPFEGAQPLGLENLSDVDPDAVVLVTAHDEFGTIDWNQFEELVIVDGRDAVYPDTDDHWLYRIGQGRR
ncbi:UDP-N-acetyl-D-mannosaminuronic acid dehydrogenase [Halovenus aranensis]|uniref:UDP-N-acetyl-D-mannosamine dehydrogenase n=1 Tax=Halovenus aranensis TaxID=890420 RepID=A0A1G8YW33_9EURY|nr:nucleotide sugar dehydrogenase [Halovenus aranensis]SDK06991.1 UDP-N-acetyl-D-mannosaminuronic acid dehydrogenase [Halovenus aranensis]